MAEMNPTNSPVPSPAARAVVIGYGNTLRGDDAVGPVAAQVVAGWGLAGVQALVVPQLTPELAAVLAISRRAIFVDACICCDAQSVRVRRLQPQQRGAILAHTSDTESLLALARGVYGRCPTAWGITVPAASFEVGVGLSPSARRGMAAALSRLARLLRR
jgi:hydrogenase maturation protease